MLCMEPFDDMGFFKPFIICSSLGPILSFHTKWPTSSINIGNTLIIDTIRSMFCMKTYCVDYGGDLAIMDCYSSFYVLI
jgi:hypothetical protein